MKRASILLVVLLVTGCGGQDRLYETTTEVEAVEEGNGMQKIVTTETSQLAEAEKPSLEEREPITSQQIEDILVASTPPEDQLVELEVAGDVIYLAVKLAGSDQEALEAQAFARHDVIANELLQWSGWEQLTIDFVDLGTITSFRSDAEVQGDGYYFSEVTLLGNAD